MRARLSQNEIVEAFSKALNQSGILEKEDTSAIFYDLTFLEERASAILKLFPQSAVHAVAVKANPLIKTLRKLQVLGMGAEAASLPELHLAKAAGFPPERIVFDSPAKSNAELIYAIEQGVHINADSLMELDRIDKLLGGTKPKGSIGVRVNPQIGEGKNRSTSTAGEYSKFGVPIKQFKLELLDRFKRYSWLSGIHVHIGSQTIEVPQLLGGIELTLDFVREVLADRDSNNQSVFTFDLGGGLPVSYHDADLKGDIAAYHAALSLHFPELFTPKYKLITEFGRYIHSPTGWCVSRVESVKRDFRVFDTEVNTATIHLGADMFLRKCYNPDKWDHELFVVDSSGILKNGVDRNPYKIAGPLCFSGDIIADGLCLPRVEEEDFMIIRDTGAYTLSMWSRYNSRQIPKVIGYRAGGTEFEILRNRETVASIIDFWNGPV